MSRFLPLIVCVAAFALFAATIQSTPFSDGVYLSAKVAAGPKPYYNALYIPAGWAFHRAFEPLFGWSAFTALGWFSALCGAGAAGLLARGLQRLGSTPLSVVSWSAFFIVTPGVWFFSTCVEVHGIQLLGATAATLLAWRARSCRRGRALALLYAACALALLSHLTTVLLLPGLALLARGRGDSVDEDVEPKGLGLRGLPWRAVLAAHGALFVLALGVFWIYSGNEEGLSRSNPLQALGVFGRKYIDKIQGGRFYGPAEIANFLDAELLQPAGLLVICPLIALSARGRAALHWPALLALLPYVVVLPEGGIREGGAYFLSFYPLFVLAAADSWNELVTRPSWRKFGPAALVSFVLLQALSGAMRWSRAENELDAREWVTLVEPHTPPGSLVFTRSLARFHALKYGELSRTRTRQVDLNREFEMVPRSGWEKEALHNLGVARTFLQNGSRVFLDADFLDAEERPASHERFEELLRRQPLRLAPIPADAVRPLLYELVLEDAGG